MRKLTVTFLLAISVMAVAIIATGCSSEKTTNEPLAANAPITDPSTATLEQVLEQSRQAASEITSYRTRGTTTWRSSTTEFDNPIQNYGEHDSSGNAMWGNRSEYYGNESFWEWRTVGNQTFNRSDDHDWEEASAPSSSRTPIVVAEHFLSLLNDPEIELFSTHERTEDGTKVYRLGFSEQQESNERSGYIIKMLSTTVLVSQESFRIVSVLHDSVTDHYEGLTASEIDSETHFRWIQGLSTYHYFDFNEPIVIDVPDDYTPWDESATAAEATGSTAISES